MMGSVDARLALGNRIIVEAMNHARRAFGGSGGVGRVKTPGDLVTDADLAIEALVSGHIAALFPKDAVVGEETGGTQAARGFGWLIDPIDGTVNFARGIGYFCVSLTLVAEGRAVAAWIGDPLSGEIFHAGPAGGLSIGTTPAPARQAPVPGTPRLVGVGFSPRHAVGLDAEIVARLSDAGMEFRRLGSGALCLAHVAAGRLDAYLEPHMNPWDAAGGLHIATASGAVTLAYPPLAPNCRGGPVFAADPALADALLAVLPAPFADLTPAVRTTAAPNDDPNTYHRRKTS